MSSGEFESLGRRFQIRPERAGSDVGPFRMNEIASSSQAQCVPTQRGTDAIDPRSASGQTDLEPSTATNAGELKQMPAEAADVAMADFADDSQMIVDPETDLKDLTTAMSVLVKNGDNVMAARVAVEILKNRDIDLQQVSSLYDVFEAVGDQTGQEEVLLRMINDFTLDEQRQFDALKNLGNIQLRLQDFDGAEENYFKAYRINPNSDALLVNMGTLEFRKQDYQQARERFVQALTANSENDRAWVGLGLVHSCYGDFVLAIANLERAIELNPENRTAIQLYSEMAFKHGSLQKLIERVERYLLSHSGDVEVLLIHAKVCLVLSRHSACEQSARSILNAEPGHEEALKLIEAAQEHMSRGQNS
jgi:tetratricopeptide (TPR) repeat protein